MHDFYARIQCICYLLDWKSFKANLFFILNLTFVFILVCTTLCILKKSSSIFNCSKSALKSIKQIVTTFIHHFGLNFTFIFELSIASIYFMLKYV